MKKVACGEGIYFMWRLYRHFDKLSDRHDTADGCVTSTGWVSNMKRPVVEPVETIRFQSLTMLHTLRLNMNQHMP